MFTLLRFIFFEGLEGSDFFDLGCVSKQQLHVLSVSHFHRICFTPSNFYFSDSRLLNPFPVFVIANVGDPSGVFLVAYYSRDLGPGCIKRQRPGPVQADVN